jgi:hypothetical protein
MISSKRNDFVETSSTSKFTYKHDKPAHEKISVRFYFREQVAQVDPGSLYLVTFVYWIQVTAWPQILQTDKKSNLSTPQRAKCGPAMYLYPTRAAEVAAPVKTKQIKN